MKDEERCELPLLERAKLDQCEDCPTKRANELIPPTITRRRRVQTVPMELRISESRERGIHSVGVYPQTLFRCEELHVGDSLDGEGTKVIYVLVGCRVQHEALLEKPLPTKELMRLLKERDWKLTLDTCERALGIWFHVEFLKDCEFRAVMKGPSIKETP